MKNALLVVTTMLALAATGCPGGDDTPEPTMAAPAPAVAPTPAGPPPFAAT